MGRAPAAGRKLPGLFFHQMRSRPSSFARRRFGSANSPSSYLRVSGLIPSYSRSKIRG